MYKTNLMEMENSIKFKEEICKLVLKIIVKVVLIRSVLHVKIHQTLQEQKEVLLINVLVQWITQ